MIQPINGINFSNRTSFKAYYDPTCPNIPASMRENSKDIMEHMIDSVKETVLKGLPSKMKSVVEGESGLKILDANNLLNTKTGMAVHFTPDGMPITYSTTNNASAVIQDSANQVDKVSGGITPIDGNNFLDGNGDLTHILQSGDPVTIPQVDIPDDGGVIDTIIDIIDTIS